MGLLLRDLEGLLLSLTYVACSLLLDWAATQTCKLGRIVPELLSAIWLRLALLKL